MRPKDTIKSVIDTKKFQLMKCFQVKNMPYIRKVWHGSKLAQLFVLVTILSVQTGKFWYILLCNWGLKIYSSLFSQFFTIPPSLTSASNFTLTLSLWRHSLLTSLPHALLHITPPLLFLNSLSLLLLSFVSVSFFHCTTPSTIPPPLPRLLSPSFSWLSFPPLSTWSLSFSLVFAASCNIMWAECQVLPTETANYV